MLDNRCVSTACGNTCQRRTTTFILSAIVFIFALVVGAIIGALLFPFILGNLVVFIIFAIALLLAAIFIALFARCRCNN